jgi:hypothetical protein
MWSSKHRHSGQVEEGGGGALILCILWPSGVMPLESPFLLHHMLPVVVTRALPPVGALRRPDPVHCRVSPVFAMLMCVCHVCVAGPCCGSGPGPRHGDDPGLHRGPPQAV